LGNLKEQAMSIYLKNCSKSISKTVTALLGATVLIITMSANVCAQGNDNKKERPMKRPTFASLDINSDGSIDLDEFSAQEIPQGDHSVIFTHIDSDEDGMISQEEYDSHKPPRKGGGRPRD